MSRQGIVSFIRDSSKDLSDRCYAVTMAATSVTLSAIFIWDICIGEAFSKLWFLGATLLLLLVVFYVSIRFDLIRIASIVASVLLICVVLPWEYFTSDGVFGCVPIWFTYAFLFIGLNVRGKVKLVLFPMLVASAIVCYVVSYYYPELLVVHDTKTGYLDSIASLISVGVLIYFSVKFLLDLYITEKNKAEDQSKEIDELNRAQNKFFSNMSHEIRTPINTIIGLNEMIMREDISEEVAEDAENIRSASKLLLHLINDILDISRFQSGEMKINPGEYNLKDMITDVVGMMKPKAAEKNLELSVTVSPELPIGLYGDEVRIKQAVINILNNAIKYTSEGSVSFAVGGEMKDEKTLKLVFTVSDTGIGIKKESIPHLFSAFMRMDEDENKYIEGTGLGLSIVKQIVDMMGGNIRVNSIYTKGSTFVIEFPQEVRDNQGIGDYDSVVNREKRDQYRKQFEAPAAKVLVVDDTKANLMVVEKLLRDTKVNIDTALSGQKALEMTLEKDYHVIFMDHIMPEMDGIECLKAIRRQQGGRCREAKIIALTANTEPDSKTYYLNEGFDGYLLKPIDGERLETALMSNLPQDLVKVTRESKNVLEESMEWIRSNEEKKNIVITTDSLADIPPELVEKYDIKILPHLVCTDRGIFMDGVEVESNGIIKYLEDENAFIKTTANSVSFVEEFFGKNLENANDVIHISITSSVDESGYDVAVEAAKAFDNVTVFDSGHLSSGLGMMVLQAEKMQEKGATKDEIIDALTEMRSRVCTSFVTENLDYLARAKIVNKNIARITKALMMHPVLVLSKGKIRLKKVIIGSRERARKKYISYALRTAKRIDDREAFITYVGVSVKELDFINVEVENRFHFKNIYYQKASPAISADCGPGTFGVIYMTK